MTALNGTGRISNAGKLMAFVHGNRPYYADLLMRARREDSRLSLIDYHEEHLWCPAQWVEEWKARHGK